MESQEVVEARARYEASPENPQMLQELVLVLSRTGLKGEAMERGISLARAFPREASAWSTLGLVMQRAGTWEGAEMAYRRALLLRPQDALCMSNLGMVLRKRGEWQDALGFFQRSLTLDDSRAEVWSTYGNALLQAGETALAVQAQVRAVEMEPARATLWANLSNGYRQQGKLDQALLAVERGLSIAPELPGLHWNRALVLLSQGRLEPGFKGYEWRYRRSGIAQPDWLAHAWTGESLSGTLELHTEQGFGDALQFARFAAAAAERVGEVVLRVHPRMVKVLSRVPGVARVLSRDEWGPEPEAHHYLMSMPAVLGIGTVSSEPYLRADSQRVEAWRRRLEAGQRDGRRFRVGICWQGNPSFEADVQRSPPLASYEALAAIPGLRLISLQKHHGLEQLRQQHKLMTIEDMGRELDNEGQAFVDTAALMKSLDLVVSSDTAVAHLAGALGVETWVALNSCPDWRWGMHSGQCSWYRSMRLFRQPVPGAWDRVFSQVADALAEKVGVSG